MEDQYKLTAMGWANSPDPPILAAALKKIHKFAATGSPQELIQTGFHELFLKNGGQTLENSGLNLLSHLVSNRWADLSDKDKESLFQIMPSIITGAAVKTAWSTKNKAAILLSQLIAKEPVTAWKKLVAACMARYSYDEIKAESSIVTCLLEGISIPGDGFKDQRTKDMKAENWDWLSETLFSLLEKHIAMFDPAQSPKFQQHNDLVLCIANTACAYARWGEVKNLVKGVAGMNLIESCKVLLGQEAYLPAGFAYLSEICARVQPTDCDEGVLIDIFNTVFALLGTPPHVAAGVVEFRETVHSSLFSVKKALGADFEIVREHGAKSLEILKARGLITYVEYCYLLKELCEGMLE